MNPATIIRRRVAGRRSRSHGHSAIAAASSSTAALITQSKYSTPPVPNIPPSCSCSSAASSSEAHANSAATAIHDLRRSCARSCAIAAAVTAHSSKRLEANQVGRLDSKLSESLGNSTSESDDDALWCQSSIPSPMREIPATATHRGRRASCSTRMLTPRWY